jgi:outer membrane protein OmpA-like peptidoglycan-associated protein
MQFRIGYHGGVKVFVPPPPAVALAPAPPQPAPEPPAPPPPPPPAPVANRAPTVRALCDPCSVEAGKTSALRAQTSDPDDDELTVRWSATGGTLTDTRTASTTWNAETAPGLITFTVTADDGRGGTATDTITIDVTSVEEVSFEDVFFDFDSSKLRAEALPVLDEVVATLKQQPAMRLEIDGHTCDIGSLTYNMALGRRRAGAVHDYLVKRGIESSRLVTVSYGEERPAHDNTQANTRRLNRRSVLVVRITDEDRQ